MKMQMLALALAALAVPSVARSADGPPAEKKTKVITEDELRRSRSGGTVSQGTPDAPAEKKEEDAAAKKDEPAAKAEPTDEEQRDSVRKGLQAEIDHHVENIASLQKQIDDAQKELADPASVAYGQPGTTGGRQGALLKLVDDANAMIKQSQDAIDQAEDKARRAGVRVTRP